MNNFYIGFIFLLAVMFISRILSEKSNKKLNEHQKAGLIDLFSKNRIYSLGVMILTFLAFFASIEYRLTDPKLTLTLFMGIYLLYMIAMGYLSYQKLKLKKYPDSFIKSFILRSVLAFAAISIFFGLIYPF